MFTRRDILITGSGLAATMLSSHRAWSANPIRIGDISSYSAYPQSTEAQRMGWKQAVDDINKAGGIMGRTLEIVSRDDAGTPTDAVRAARELVEGEGVVMLTGTYLSNIAMAVSDYVRQARVLFLAGQIQVDDLTWSQGNKYTFRILNNNYSQVSALAQLAAKTDAKRWATIAPNYGFGQSAVKTFKEVLTRERPDVVFVDEQWPKLGKLNAAATVQALAAKRPDAIMNATFGADLAKFVREGNLRRLFKDREVFSILTGYPEYLDPLGAETPVGWTVIGYPVDQIDTPEFIKFREEYVARNNELPKSGSIIAYTTIAAAAAILNDAQTTDIDGLLKAARNVRFDSPLGPIEMREIDHNSTYPFYIGTLAVKDAKGYMTNWTKFNSGDYQPTDDDVRSLLGPNYKDS